MSIQNNNKTAMISVFDEIVLLSKYSSTVCNASQVNVQSITIRITNYLYLPEQRAVETALCSTQAPVL
nr:hypothetical protein [Bacillus sp. X1(2014)]